MKRFLLTILATLALATFAFAQSNTGRLVGTVSGPDGVLPGATVTVTDNQTNRQVAVQASGEGSFAVPQLEPGTYTVTVTAQGFRTFTATDLKIDVSRDYTLNATLEVGGVEESVTVTAGADVINQSNGELSNTVSPQQIQALPIDGKSPLSLIFLQPGSASNGSAVSINGQQAAFTNITRDGINVQDNYIRANATTFAPTRPNTDDTGEFTITTQNAGADRGYGAAQVQLVTPRGQNEYNGTLYIYNRNRAFAANDFFSNEAGLDRPKFNRNQFGGNIGGPIIKNKLFFFGFVEAFRLRESSSELRTILLPQARNGIFTFTDAAGNVRTVNLLTQLGSVTGITAIDPTIQNRILAGLPTEGNTNEAGDQRNTTGFLFNQRDNTDRETYTTRVDYDINDRNTINGVYSFTNERVTDRPDSDSPQGFGAVPVTNQPAQRKLLALAYRATPTGNFTNELRGGYFLQTPIFLRTTDLPSFFISLPTTTSIISNPEVTSEEEGRDTNTFNIQDNAELTVGNHSLRFGGQAQFFRIRPFDSFGLTPSFTIGTGANTPQLTAADINNLFNLSATQGISSTQLGTANALLALLGGVVNAGGQTQNVTSQTSGFAPGAQNVRNYAFENYAFYFADQWRVRPNFTLNLGLRYEIYTGLREKNGLGLEPIIESGSANAENLRATLVNPNGRFGFVGTNIGKPGQFFNTDADNFAPVISFAYSPNFKNNFLGRIFPGEGRSVIRGGFRMSYVNDEFLFAADNATSANQGLTLTSNVFNPDTGTTQLNARLSNLPSIPTLAFDPEVSFEENNELQGFFGTAFGIDPNLQATRTIEYNLSFEREIGFQTAIELRYVGGFSNNLVRAFDLNQVDIRSNGFLADFNRARQNLLLVQAERSRVTNDPTLTAAQRTARLAQLPVRGAFNATVSGSQTLTVFPNLGGANTRLAATAQVVNALNSGAAADLAINLQVGGLNGTVPFLQNPNAGPVDLLTNGGRYNYNALQVEVRRRFSQGLFFQANYTFSKNLTDVAGTTQTNFEPFLDFANPQLEYSRADADQTHVFNANASYELPFGRGRRFFTDAGGFLNRLVSGFSINTIIRADSGAPISFIDTSGTLNRNGRSGRQTANSTLTPEQIRGLVGIRRTPDGVFFIDPSVINPVTGQAAGGFGSTAFEGQVFFDAEPGQTGNLPRGFINGPTFFGVDLGLIKNIPITEGTRLQLRVEAFNAFNRANFFVGNRGTRTNVNSTLFGRVASTFDPRQLQFAARFEF